jgi:hypothetical protein
LIVGRDAGECDNLVVGLDGWGDGCRLPVRGEA